MKIINCDKGEFRTGKSVYGEEYQIEINEEKINNYEYLKLVQRGLTLLKKKTEKHRKERMIVYHNPSTEKRQRAEKTVLSIRYTNNGIEPKQPYNKWLVAVIQKNERERENLTSIAKMLKIN